MTYYAYLRVTGGVGVKVEGGGGGGGGNQRKVFPKEKIP